jgi:anti-sigma regulatory factor (Ser/Thr protein kinase)
VSSGLAGPHPGGGFRHEAFLYSGDDELLAGAAAFAQGALVHDEPMLVVLAAAKIDRLRTVLGDDACRIRFEDVSALGRNPARLIPVWQEFLDDNGGGQKPLRGIGEPVAPGVGGPDLDEREHHEALANFAFAEAPAFWALCPYDTSRLDREVVARACDNHLVLRENGDARPSSDYRDTITPDGNGWWGPPLSPAPPGAAAMAYSLPQLHQLRGFVGAKALHLGLVGERVDDLVLAVNELASNSIRYADGRGTFRIWDDEGTIVCQVEDVGHITDPLAGRRSPRTFGDTSRGLWVVNQLCDLVQIRSSCQGTVIRLHMYGPGGPVAP